MEQHPIKINKVQIRNLQIEDYVQLSQSFTRVYSDGRDEESIQQRSFAESGGLLGFDRQRARMG